MSRTSKYIYEDNYQKIKYTIQLSYNENEIIFNIKEENILNKEFESSFSLDSLIEKNPIFKVCNKIENCYDYFLRLLNNKKYSIMKEKNTITFIFLIKNVMTEKDEEMKLFLNSKALEINSIIESYNNKIKDLKNENNLLKNEILNLKKISQEYESFKENINSIIDRKINQYINQQKKNENIIFSELNNSSILINFEEKYYFLNLINCKNIKLLYRLTRDGSEPKDFHRLCDNQGPTLTLLLSQNNRKFGGYLSKNWESSGDWKKDNNIFLFSIDLIKIYKLKNNNIDNYYCNKNIGPCFLEFGFRNYGNLLDTNKCKEKDLTNYYESDPGYQCYEISGDTEILCKDVEVYKIEF